MRLPQPALDAHEYLQREARVDQRYEFVNGQAYPLSSGTLQHGQLITRILGHAFNAAERHSRCNVLTQSVKLHVPARNSFYYPDVMVTCEPVFREQDIVRAPCCVVEVLSPSTSRVDLTLKRSRYEAAGCPSYWVVDPDEPALTAWELRDGEYVEVGHASGAEQYTATMPYDVVISPARLLD